MLFWPKSSGCCCGGGGISTPECFCGATPPVLYMTACHPEFADAGGGGAGTFNSATLRYGPTPAGLVAGLGLPEDSFLSDEDFPEVPGDPDSFRFRYYLSCGLLTYILEQVFEEHGPGGPISNPIYHWSEIGLFNHCSPFRLVNGFLPPGSGYDRRAVLNISEVEGDDECDTFYLTIGGTTQFPCVVPGVEVAVEGGTPATATADANDQVGIRIPNPPAGDHDWSVSLPAPFIPATGTLTTTYSMSAMTRSLTITPALLVPADRFKYYGITLDPIPAAISATFNNHALFGTLGGTTVSLARTATSPAAWSGCFAYTGGTDGDGGGTVTVTFSPEVACDERPTAAVRFNHHATDCAGALAASHDLPTVVGTTVAPIAFVASVAGGAAITFSE